MATEYGNGSALLSVEMEGPFGGSGSYTKITSVTIYADKWKGAISPYSQVVTVDSVSVNSKVDLQPTAEQLEALSGIPVSLMAENNDGVVTVYAVGEKPEKDFTIQATITEVLV